MSRNGAPRVVLVVEDEPIVRHAIAQELRNAGWEVLESSTAEIAIAYLRAGRHIDLVLTDIQLAGPLNGWDVAEQFRAVHENFPIIYASGNSVDRSRSVTGSLFFDKPYRLDDVVQACHRLS